MEDTYYLCNYLFLNSDIVLSLNKEGEKLRLIQVKIHKAEGDIILIVLRDYLVS